MADAATMSHGKAGALWPQKAAEADDREKLGDSATTRFVPSRTAAIENKRRP